jgi:hypothetical protein
MLAKSQSAYPVAPASVPVVPPTSTPTLTPPQQQQPPPIGGGILGNSALTDLPENQKALIQQVLSLTPEQIEKLPTDVIISPQITFCF